MLQVCRYCKHALLWLRNWMHQGLWAWFLERDRLTIGYIIHTVHGRTHCWLFIAPLLPETRCASHFLAGCTHILLSLTEVLVTLATSLNHAHLSTTHIPRYRIHCSTVCKTGSHFEKSLCKRLHVDILTTNTTFLRGLESNSLFQTLIKSIL